MYRLSLSPQQRQHLQERARQTSTAPNTRDRLEMVRLCDAGWSVPRIARHLGHHEQTVRFWIKAFLKGGFEALVDQPRGGKSSALTSEKLAAVRERLAVGDRTWTTAQIAQWIAQEQGVRLSQRRLREHLRRAGLSWQRTSRTLKHKQCPEEVARKQAALEVLEKGVLRG